MLIPFLPFLFACQPSTLGGNWHVTTAYPENLAGSSLSSWDPQELTGMALTHSMQLLDVSPEEHFEAYALALAEVEAHTPELEELVEEEEALYCTGRYDLAFNLAGLQNAEPASSSTEHSGEIFVIDRRAIASAGPRPLVELRFFGVGQWSYAYGETDVRSGRPYSGRYVCTGSRGQIAQLSCSIDYTEELEQEASAEEHVQFELSR